MYTEGQWAEISELKNRIEQKAFQKESFEYETNIWKAEGERRARRYDSPKKSSITTITRIKLYNPRLARGEYQFKSLVAGIKKKNLDLLADLDQYFTHFDLYPTSSLLASFLR